MKIKKFTDWCKLTADTDCSPDRPVRYKLCFWSPMCWWPNSSRTPPEDCTNHRPSWQARLCLEIKKKLCIFCKFCKRVQAYRVYMAFKGPSSLETEHAFVLTPQWFWMMINQRLYIIVKYYHGWYRNDRWTCISTFYI